MARGINIKLYNRIILSDSIQFSTLLANSQILKFSSPFNTSASNYKLEPGIPAPMTNFQSMTKAPQDPFPTPQATVPPKLPSR
jgi:hypothetical protein